MVIWSYTRRVAKQVKLAQNGHLALRGQARGDADHVRLGHADVEEVRRMAAGHRGVGAGGLAQVRLQAHHVRVLLDQFVQRLAVDETHFHLVKVLGHCGFLE